MKREPKRPGRPRKSSGELQTEYLDVRLTPAEKQAFKDAAETVGLAVSAWVRQRLRHAAVKDLETVGKRAAFLEHLYRG